MSDLRMADEGARWEIRLDGVQGCRPELNNTNLLDNKRHNGLGVSQMTNETIQKIEARLKAAYHHRADYEVSGMWRREAMRRIRDMGSLYPQVPYLGLLEQFMWQLAPVTCLVIVVMGTLIANYGWIPDTHLVDLILNESQEAFSLYYMMGMG